jgi:glycosyltransferase involved in cell wall biosynthesis
MRIGWRIHGSGKTVIKFLQLGNNDGFIEESFPLDRSETLLLTNHYPSHEDIYRNGFVHSRVLAYKDHGVDVDVFRFQTGKALAYHEFQNIDVTTGDQNVLRMALDNGHYKNILVHFLSAEIWEVLQQYPHLNCVAWIHGAEIHAWHRRNFNYRNEHEKSQAKLASDKKSTFWRSILQSIPANLKLVFVSRSFAEEVMEDLGFRISDDKYVIIHNPIDTNKFSYELKSAEQRKRILSIRPYHVAQYANDLSVAAIIKLAEKPFFKDLEFRLIGNGILFDETLKPLRNFSNVIIEKRFLTQPEIAQLHKDYGVFLCPTRWDSHGVSRDEAMSSGLVPVTNKIAAIPEFVDETCGILANPEDADGLASGIVTLYENPSLFESLSWAAANRVRRQSGVDVVLEKELAMFNERVK